MDEYETIGSGNEFIKNKSRRFFSIDKIYQYGYC